MFQKDDSGCCVVKTEEAKPTKRLSHHPGKEMLVAGTRAVTVKGASSTKRALPSGGDVLYPHCPVPCGP